MKTYLKNLLFVPALLALLSTINLQLSTCSAQGTAFTYQGRLQDQGAPANGSYDLTFALFDADQSGSQAGTTLTNLATVVTNGLFTVTLDFGAQFPGADRWLAIGVRTNGVASAFTVLTPRQPVTATPYAVQALNAATATTAGSAGSVAAAGITGTIPLAQLPAVIVTNGASGVNISGTISGNGGGLTNLNAAQLTGGVISTSVLPGFQSPNYGAVGGGYYNSAGGQYSTVAGGAANEATDEYAAIPGGRNNLASGKCSLAAGKQAQATNDGAFVWADSQGTPFASVNDNSFNVRAKGGVRFETSGTGMTLDGQPVLTSGNGSGITIQQNANDAPNLISGSSVNFVALGVVGATIGGGGAANYDIFAYTNSVMADFGTVSGGERNTASGDHATVGGGTDNTADYMATIGGGADNTASGQEDTVSGGVNNQTSGTASTVGGGFGNHAVYHYTTVAGGEGNTASGQSAFIGGGGWDGITLAGNQASGNTSVIGGGHGNIASGNYSTVPGGDKNLASGKYSLAAGQQAQALNDGTFVWADSQGSTFSSTANDQFSVRAKGGVRFETSGAGMTIDGQPVLTNGSSILASQLSGTIPEGNLPNGLGGSGNTASSTAATVGGGEANTASSRDATVGGGEYNNAVGSSATVGGGEHNNANGNDAMVGGGGYNTASGGAATVGGGSGNQATNLDATVPGGANNIAGGIYSFAAGWRAQALHQGAFVWADSQGSTFSSTANDQFLIRAQGGVGIGTPQPGTLLDVQGNGTANGGVSGYNEVVARFKNTRAGSHSAVVIDALDNQSSVLYFSENGVPKWDLRHDRNDDALKAFWHNGSAFTTPLTLTTNGNLTVIGSVTATAFNMSSDRNLKEDFAPVSAQTVLAKVAALPITEWNYKTDAAGQKHLGPMAQDFHAAFDLNGTDDKHISVIDEGGVALAAIQGLNEKLEQKQTEITELKQQLGQLAQTVNQLNQKLNGGAQ